MTENDWVEVPALVRFWRQSGCDISATAREFGIDEDRLRRALDGEVPIRRKRGVDGEWDEDSFSLERLQLGRIRRRLGLNQQAEQ
jgi:hypothetical protein